MKQICLGDKSKDCEGRTMWYSFPESWNNSKQEEGILNLWWKIF